MRVVIRNALLPAPFTPAGLDPNTPASVWLLDGKIEGYNLNDTPDLDLDARGGLLVPAFVDLHAHLRDPGQEVKETLATGLAAAAAGGYGTVVSMPNTTPPVDDPSQVLDLIERAEALDGPRLLPSAAVTRGQAGQALTDMAALKAAGAR
ncbi:MAG TPA: amidohydrolase family protein, partial [Deinococcales bacterium]|nr:amidohydrolase family protein [Deinococcales bacterium]